MDTMENVKEKKETKLASACHYSTMTNKLTISRKSLLKNDKEENFSEKLSIFFNKKHNDSTEKLSHKPSKYE